MNLITINYTDRVHQRYLHDFFNNVLSGLFDEDLIPDYETFFDMVSGKKNWICILAVAEGRVAGGITAEYLEQCRCGVLEFVQTRPGFDSIQELLIQEMVLLLRRRYRGLRHIFIELVNNAGNLMGGLFRKWCVALNIEYVTPPIKEGAEPGIGMKLCLVDEMVDSILGSSVYAFIEEYFVVAFGSDKAEEYIPRLEYKIKTSRL